jgi:hypothetical protein
MTSRADHVLLTRFNLPSASAERIIRARQGWLEERVGLFERYCLPSVQAQTSKDLHWIIYFDPESPAWLKDWIDGHRSLGFYQPIFRQSVSPDELRADILSVVGTPRDELITSNLDNDDGLAADFTERIRSAGRKGARSAIYITAGLVKHEDRLYVLKDARNAFCSVRESGTSPLTCWCDWHNLLGSRMPVIEVGGRPGWLQVIHGRNVSNRIRGTYVSPSSYAQDFPGLITDVRAPTARDRARDLLISRPTRVAKESGRQAAKAVALSLLGRDGFDRAKLIWAESARIHRR